jgi:peptide/nickel transport system ATP-binding protein
MYLGKIVEIAENASLFEAPRHPYTRALLSAVPTLESNPFPRSQLLLDGEPPSPINLPTGCTFYSRCPMRTDICRQAEPELSSAQDGGEVACYFAGSVVAVRLAAAEA